MKFVIVGSDGFLGSHIVKELNHLKLQTLPVSRLERKRYINANDFWSNLEYKQEDTTHIIDLMCFQAGDIPGHLPVPQTTFHLISSTSVYKPMNIRHLGLAHPFYYSSTDSYISGKLEAEDLLRTRNFTHRILRPCMIIGPGDSSGRSKNLFQLFLSEKRLATKRLSTDLIQTIDVRDCAHQIVNAVLRDYDQKYESNIVSDPLAFGVFVDTIKQLLKESSATVDFGSSEDMIPFAKHDYSLSQNTIPVDRSLQRRPFLSPKESFSDFLDKLGIR